MKNLSFEKLPHYFFSANRQFEENECHMTRIYGLSVLLLVRKGVLRFTENDVPAEVGAGEYYIQKPNLYQRGPRPSDAPNYYFIHFMGHYSNGGALPVRGKFNIDHIQPIIQELEALDNSAEKIEYECLFYKLLMTLKNDLDEKPRAEKMRTFLLENYTQQIRLDDLCKISLLSKNQTINVFRETYGTTPHRYLTNFRIRKASELILATDLPLQEICYQVGFTEYSSFFKLFSAAYGQTPFDYRKNHSPKMLPEGIYFTP